MSAAVGTILLVEDNADDAFLVARAMRFAGLANPIETLTDGDQAIAYLAGEGEFSDRVRYPLPVLVLLDLKLPRRTGFEVLEWLRAQDGLRRLRVVVLTSSREPADVNLAHELGANTYLVKPVSFGALVEMVRVLGLHWLVVSEAPQVV